MKVDVIVPCYNEGPRVGRILKILQDSPYINKIIFVDDGSTDNSSEVAKSFSKIKMIKLKKNLGKGGAVRKGLKYVDTDAVFLCDADLRGLKDHHIRKLMMAYSKHPNSLVIAHRRVNKSNLRYFGRYKITPRLDGERILSKKDLEKVVASEFADGYGLEAWMNYYFRKNRKKTRIIPLYGLMDGPLKRKRVKDRAMEAKEILATYSDIYRLELKKSKALVKVLSEL